MRGKRPGGAAKVKVKEKLEEKEEEGEWKGGRGFERISEIAEVKVKEEMHIQRRRKRPRDNSLEKVPFIYKLLYLAMCGRQL